MKATFPTREQIARAAEQLKQGDLVAFPTETVYGLGAHALNAAAVERIFALKQRPRTSPLIVHVPGEAQARELVTEWPESASVLAARFWPGPLTLVLPKRNIVPEIVTAGLGSVGVRVPRHPVALALLEAAGLPVAAPSANLFMRLSPTSSHHVSFPGITILEGGDAEVGIESTVVSLAGAPRLLRPGAISRGELEALIGPVLTGGEHVSEAPGLHPRHYRPQTPLYWAEERALSGPGVRLTVFLDCPEGTDCIAMPRDPQHYAVMLYRVLHDLDQRGLAWISVERLPQTEAWAAVRDRLSRAVQN